MKPTTDCNAVQRPKRAEIPGLIQAILSRKETLTIGRSNFAVTAIYCQTNEGISPGVTGTLTYRNFHFGQKWVEFAPRLGKSIVRRLLSEQTRDHLESQMRRLKAKPDDVIHSYRPWRVAHPTRPDGSPFPNTPTSWQQALDEEVRMAGFDQRRFASKQLRFVWLDDHPHFRGDEVRVTIVAKFILKWAKPFQQEALLRLLYKNTAILRPSWAYPQYALKGDPEALSPV